MINSGGAAGTRQRLQADRAEGRQGSQADQARRWPTTSKTGQKSAP